MIYFDNAATTKKKPRQVIDAVCSAMENFGNASRGTYDESLSADIVIYKARSILNDLFHGYGAKQVSFTKNATEALNIAIRGVLDKGDHVITSEMEHNSVIRPLNHLIDEKNISVDYLKMDEKGTLNPEDLKKLINSKTKALILNHASNVTGNINDLKKYGKFCKENGLLFIVDASQSVGIIPINMKENYIDILCFTGHKSLFGPQGTGGLLVNKDIVVKPLITGGTGVQSFNSYQPKEMPTALEAGTLNSHGIAGLYAGVKYIFEKDQEKLAKKSQILSERFYSEIKKISSIKCYGDFTDFNKRTPVISINISDIDSSKVSEILAEEFQIATRPGAHCAPLLHKAFETIEQGIVRFSFSSMNTEKEIEKGIEAVKHIAQSN